MPKHLLQYWKPETAAIELAEPTPFRHSASDQYRKMGLEPGDVLWIVTAWQGGWLSLIGRLQVGRVVDRQEAERLLGTTNLWDATYYAIASPGRDEPLRDIDLSDLVAEIRFASKNDRLAATDGRVSGTQLQAMRHLTHASAEMLEHRWREDTLLVGDGHDAETLLGNTTGFGSAETNRRVEMTAVKAVTAQLEMEGWKVESKESLRIGYDLLCTREIGELHVEVKGTQADQPSFILTEAELRRAETDELFELYVVTRALEPSPFIFRFTGAQVSEQFALQPLAYRAAPKYGRHHDIRVDHATDAERGTL